MKQKGELQEINGLGLWTTLLNTPKGSFGTLDNDVFFITRFQILQDLDKDRH